MVELFVCGLVRNIMKKLMVVGLVLFCCIGQAFADDKVGNIKVSLFSALLVEYKVADKVTLGLDFSTWNPVVDLSNNQSLASTGSLGARVYWYPKGALQQGSYATVFLDYASFDYYNGQSRNDQIGSGNVALFGFISGYHWVWDSFNISLGGGYGFMPGTSIDVKDKRTGAVSSVDIIGDGGLNFDFHIGFSF